MEKSLSSDYEYEFAFKQKEPICARWISQFLLQRKRNFLLNLSRDNSDVIMYKCVMGILALSRMHVKDLSNHEKSEFSELQKA